MTNGRTIAVLIAIIVIFAVVFVIVLSPRHLVEKDVRLDFNDEVHPLATTFDNKAVYLTLEQGDEYYYGLTIKANGQEYFTVIIMNEVMTVGGINFKVTQMDSDGIELHLYVEKGPI